MSAAGSIVTEVNALSAEFAAGKLSASEYKELLEDIKHIKVIQVAADDLALKSQLNNLINTLITGAGFLL
jgi:hypothetical protein